MDNNYVTFRCPNEHRAKLELLAKDGDRSLSAEIRRAIGKHLSAQAAVLEAIASDRATK